MNLDIQLFIKLFTIGYIISVIWVFNYLIYCKIKNPFMEFNKRHYPFVLVFTPGYNTLVMFESIWLFLSYIREKIYWSIYRKFNKNNKSSINDQDIASLYPSLDPGVETTVLTYSELFDVAKYLYRLLDDIDTTGDVAKSNDKLYRKLVEQIHRKKHKVATTDGYNIVFNRLENPKDLEGVYSDDSPTMSMNASSTN